MRRFLEEGEVGTSYESLTIGREETNRFVVR